jgi:two-component system cell cycle response regulator
MAGRILIADDVATNRIVLKAKLAAACYDVLQASGGYEALRLAREEQPDLVLLDVMMPDLDGVSVCEMLKNDPGTCHIPVVMVTAHSDDTSKFNALRAGADEFLSKPLDELGLLARVRSLLRARDTDEELRLRDSTCRELGFAEPQPVFQHPARVALVAASRKTAMDWQRTLVGRTDATIDVLPKEDVLTGARLHKTPDVYIIAADLAAPDDGLRLLSELRSRPQTRHSAIMIVIPPGENGKSATALDLGANDLVCGGFRAEELALRLKTQIRRKRQADKLRATVRDGLRMAAIDPLTGLYNRRYAFSHLARMADRAAMANRPFAVMLLDLDRFKRVNDTYGHAAGDIVLETVAARIRENLRGVDLVARIGGEEFLVAMPDTRQDEARHAAERLCNLVRETPVTLSGGGPKYRSPCQSGWQSVAAKNPAKPPRPPVCRSLWNRPTAPFTKPKPTAATRSQSAKPRPNPGSEPLILCLARGNSGDTEQQTLVAPPPAITP